MNIEVVKVEQKRKVQGVVHGAAGMLLFLVALALMFVLDRVLDLFPWKESRA